MSQLLPNIRNAARALILKQEKVLMLRKEDREGFRYALPGGGQETGESLKETLLRECVEEIGCEIRIRELLHVADYFRPRSTNPPTVRHMVEFLFICEVPDDYEPCNGSNPDKHQVDVVWADLEELSRLPIFPKSLVANLLGMQGKSGHVYLGSVK
ncbi:MAG: NUDIX domain-containing protein [Ketobacteraceae bacterium]|nr:NUDIX domain-containing protein [Ketobacteraceae bacterium]